LQPLANLLPLFDYAAFPFDVQEHSVATRDIVTVYDISYTSPKNGRVTAYLLVPLGAGPFAGVLFAHPADGDRSYFLSEAVSLARAGAIAILVDSPWARPDPWRRDLDYSPENDLAIYVQEIVDLRRAVDLLAAQENVDPARLGFIGYSYGAHLGGVLSGIDGRLRAYVLMAGVPTRSERIPRRIATTFSSGELAAYRQALRSVDAIQYVGHAAPAALFFQCARQDEVIAEATSQRYYEAASQPKQVVWYEAGHMLNEQAYIDRAQWLAEQLGLDSEALK